VEFIARLQNVVSETQVGLYLRFSISTSKVVAVSRHQNAGQNHEIKVADKFFENVAQFKYLGTTIRNENLIQEEIRGD
jgi:hypothetical protein